MGVNDTSNSPRALISVYDKSGVVEFARQISDMGWEILSTGGTARLLKENNIDVIDVTDVTGHPESIRWTCKDTSPAFMQGF